MMSMSLPSSAARCRRCRPLRRPRRSSPRGDQRSLHRWLDQFPDAETVGEFADEISHYLVDVSGDPEFTASRWFHSAHHPWVPLFQRLITWDEQGRAADELAALLANVRQILAETV